MSSLPALTPAVGEDVSTRRYRGKSKQANWQRTGDVSVIVLDLDMSSDPVMRRRVEAQFLAAYQLERALKRQTRAKCEAFWDARHERAEKGPKMVQERLGLNRNAVAKAAYKHVDDSVWLRHHLTKAVACHMADHIWESARRHLFQDKTGKRAGAPHVGSWWRFTKLTGRARSHTKRKPVWETWRLVGSLQGHLDAWGGGVDVDQASQIAPGGSVFAQPGALPAPVKPPRTSTSPGGWWNHTGALAVVFTGLPSGDMVMPVRLPQGAGSFPRLVHFLADPSLWHKIDLIRVQDRKAPGRWRYQAHLTILGHGYCAPSTIHRRSMVPGDRVAGLDANVSNLAAVSMPDPTLGTTTTSSSSSSLVATLVCPTRDEETKAIRHARAARKHSRALDRSRRASNPDQYTPSARQTRRAHRREQAGLTPRTIQVPQGGRLANSRGVPTRSYRKDTLSQSYRATKATLAQQAASTARRKDSIAKQIACDLVGQHGTHWVTEQINITTWTRIWGKRIAVTTPGRLINTLRQEVHALNGSWHQASTFTTALSQQCLCGKREKKPLSQRWHSCSHCGLQADRDLLAAALAACVTLTNQQDPSTAKVDPELREALKHRVMAQQEGPTRSTTTHPTTGDTSGSQNHVLAPAGHNDSPGQPRNSQPQPTHRAQRHRKDQTHGNTKPET